MKRTPRILTVAAVTLVVIAAGSRASSAGSTPHCDASEKCPKQLFLDVHELTPGGVTSEAVRAAHRQAHGLLHDRVLEVTQGK